jgi:hypothetical protein
MANANYGKQPIAAAVQQVVQPNQLDRRLLSICGVNPWDGFDSAGRKQMLSSHLGQRLTIKGANERWTQTGMEDEFGKYTSAIRVPSAARVVKVIERYRRTHGADAIAMNPETIVIFEDLDNGRYDIMRLENHCSNHQYFGFKYLFRPVVSEIRKNAFLKKGTVIADSPAVDPKSGAYKLGIMLNVCNITVPGVSEDSIVICRDVLPKLAFKTYETRVVEYGSRMFPTNLYGDKNRFKAYPDIGEYIKAGPGGRGMLMNLRTYEKNLAVVEMSTKALMEIDYVYDKPVYVGEGGRVVDIRIHHDNNSNAPSPTPTGMETQSLRYDNARRHFYQEVLDEYDLIKRELRQTGREPKLSPRFKQLIVTALSVVGKDDGQKVVMLHRQAPVDDFRLEFTIEYDIVPTEGFKLTDFHGGKGVLCEIWEPWEMPVDADGNRADVLFDPNSKVSRMNLGGLYEPYVNAATRDTAKRIREMVGWDSVLGITKPEVIEFAHAYALRYYQIASPKQYEMFASGRYGKTKEYHIEHICKEGIYLYLPPDNPVDPVEMVDQLEAEYPSCYGPVTYVGRSGKRVTTKTPARIAPVYFMLLEKTGDDWTAVSSGKTQHFGVLAQVTNADKYSQPTRTQAIRALGEAEVRIYVSYAGVRITAEQMDRNNNPHTHEHLLYNLLRAEKPTDIWCAVDRSVIPFGGAKPQQLVNHIAECAGWEFAYQPYDPGPVPKVANGTR